MTAEPWLLSYEQVADSLPTPIRRAIEEVVPCRRGSEHQWDDEDPRFTERPGFDKARHPFRECTDCGVMRPNPDYRQRR